MVHSAGQCKPNLYDELGNCNPRSGIVELSVASRVPVGGCGGKEGRVGCQKLKAKTQLTHLLTK